MKVLVVKTSSMGDVVHTFPALSDASHSIEGIRFDWVVEEAFQEMPTWHPAVDRVIPSAMRRWRKSWLGTWLKGEWGQFVYKLREQSYDAVIDAQGLIKSALITRKCTAEKHGLDSESARESLASMFYDHKHHVPGGQHAIERTRQLFAAALDYDLSACPFRYGISAGRDTSVTGKSIMMLTGTTWPSKRWPLNYWSSLIERAVNDGYRVLLPAGNGEERNFVKQLSMDKPEVEVIQGRTIPEIARLLAAMEGVISVDTGLAHLAAALNIPTVALYGTTDALLTGIKGEGKKQHSMQSDLGCSPCLKRICPELSISQSVQPCTQSIDVSSVWEKLQENM